MESNQKMRSIRLKEAIDYLKENGVINNQKDLAEKLRVTPETITRAVKCQGNNPTDNFLEKFARTYSDYFNEPYIINGVGMLLKRDNADTTVKDLTDELRHQLKLKDKQIDFLTSQINTKDEQIKEQNETIKMLRSMLSLYTEAQPLDKKAVASL